MGQWIPDIHLYIHPYLPKRPVRVGLSHKFSANPTPVYEHALRRNRIRLEPLLRLYVAKSQQTEKKYFTGNTRAAILSTESVVTRKNRQYRDGIGDDWNTRTRGSRQNDKHSRISRALNSKQPTSHAKQQGIATYITTRESCEHNRGSEGHSRY